MKVTVALKAHGVAKSWWKADAADKDVSKIAFDKIAADELTLDEAANLTKEAPRPARRESRPSKSSSPICMPR